jgi:hypothetical protein
MYHELVVEISFGSLNEDQLAIDIGETEIALKVASEFENIVALQSPESCLSLADGECLLLNQGDAKLRITTEQLQWKHTLVSTPIFEVPYDYVIAIATIEGGLDELLNATGGSRDTIEGIECYLLNGNMDPKDRFITGERCPVLSCPCGASEEFESIGGGGGGLGYNLVAEVHGTLPSCGIFPIENDQATAHFAAKFELYYPNDDLSIEFSQSVSFSMSNVEGNLDTVDISGTLQVIVELMKDPSRYIKPIYSLRGGAVVICNWDGRYQWDGPDGQDAEDPETSSNVFPIPLVASNSTETEWTSAAWYYVDNYALIDDYQPKTTKHNGVTMLDIISHAHYHAEGFFDPNNGSASYCCTNLETTAKLSTFLMDHHLPRVTPSDVLESGVGINKNYDGLPAISYAPSYTRFRSGRPGFDPVSTYSGGPLSATDPLDVVSGDVKKLTMNNVVRPLQNYRLYGGDYALSYDAIFDTVMRPGLRPINFPLDYSLRRVADTIDVQPFNIKTKYSGGPEVPEISLRATILISDRALTGRHLNTKTLIPSLYASLKNGSQSLRCHVSPLSNTLEIVGWLCNTGTFTWARVEDLSALITCHLPEILHQYIPAGGSTIFSHQTEDFLEEDIRPRGCNKIIYNMRPSSNAPFPFSHASSFIYKGASVLKPAGTCDIAFFFKAPLHTNNIESLRNGGIGYTEVLVGKYESIECQNVDDDADEESMGIRNSSNTDRMIPDQCNDEWDVNCVVNNYNQDGEDLGGAALIIVFSVVAGFLFFVLVAMLIYTQYHDNQEMDKLGRDMGKKAIPKMTLTSRSPTLLSPLSNPAPN